MRRNELHEDSLRIHMLAKLCKFITPNRVNPDSSIHKTWFRKSGWPPVICNSTSDELYDLLVLILAQGSGGMDTDLADEELAKQMSVEVQIIMQLATKWPWNQVRTDTCYVRVTLKRRWIRTKCIRVFCSK